MGELSQPVPRRLGDFEIIREIGRGGMGVVYEAWQTSLKRRVALKVLPASLGLNSPAVARFRREAEAAAKLHHTNIVPIYATGEADGTHYYAMELVEGPALSAVIKTLRRVGTAHQQPDVVGDAHSTLPAHERPDVVGNAHPTLPAHERPGLGAMPTPSQASPELGAGSPGRVGMPNLEDGSTLLRTAGGHFDAIARLIAEVADALDYAHKQGVIHRDIKPSNLLLNPVGPVADRSSTAGTEPGRYIATAGAELGRYTSVRLSINDFGLARVLEQPGMTMTGEFMGTPRYMSPEQIAAGRAPLDHRTDIYSLGATLYELLTLEPPFPGERREQVIAQIIGKDPAPPRRINRKVPVDLETICLKALEKDPDRRYQTAGQMAADLRAYVNRFAISAKRAGPVARLAKWCRRRPAVAALAAAVFVLCAAAGLLAYGAHRSNVRVLEMRRQKAVDDAMVAAMSGQFDAARAAIEDAELLGAPPGWIRILHGLVAIHEGQPQAAVQHLDQAVRLSPENLSAWSLLAMACDQGDQMERYYPLLKKIDSLEAVTPEDFLFKGLLKAQEGFTEALDLLDEAVRRRDSAVARVVRARARWWRAIDTADLKDVKAALEDAMIAKGMLPDNPLALGEHLCAHLVAAKLFAAANQEDKVRASLAEAQGDAEALERFAGTALAHEARARYFEHIGAADAALAEFREAVALHDAYCSTVRAYAAALYRRGAFEEAIRVLDRFREPMEESGRATTHLFILTELPDGEARAMAAYREAAKGNPVGMYAFDCHFVLRLLGRRSEAVAACRRVRENFAKGLSPQMLAWYRHWADYLCGDISAAQFLKAAGDSRLKQCEAHHLIGLDCLADGDRAGASEHFQRSVDTYAFTYFEYTWSRAFLARMRQDAAWPPWIPVREGNEASRQQGNEGTRQPGNEATGQQGNEATESRQPVAVSLQPSGQGASSGPSTPAATAPSQPSTQPLAGTLLWSIDTGG